jgi:antitoxin component of MazEF toxin-antitoxin module
MKTTYLVEELFEDIEGDPNNVIMKIPPEICKVQGWKEGDTINIKVEDGAMILSKVNDITTIVRAEK